MKMIHGIGVSNGIAIGRLTLLGDNRKNVEKRQITDIRDELARLDTAREETTQGLNEIYLKSLELVGEKDSMIFQIHVMMLQDEDFFSEIQNRIQKEKINAEYAVWTVGREFSDRFAQMDDDYMQGRKTDVIDISTRLIRSLEKKSGNSSVLSTGPSIIGAVELMPSETIQMDKSEVLAFVTREGSKTSHSAILARTLQIPSVAGLGDDFQNLRDGMFVVVDGFTGVVLIEPDEVTQKEYQAKREEFIRQREGLQIFIGKKAVTKNGICMEINANIGHPDDAECALKNGADGIGLFRSEFLYMGIDSLPSEEVQFQAYKTVLEKMKNRRVIIRTLDLGADKQVPYLNQQKEENPALGYRAIRICLDCEELFYTQLRALLRASVFGKLAVMFPMIISVNEVKAAKSMVERVKVDLTADKIAFAVDTEFGIMIETPAAVMLSDQLAKEVDFFSIGTNDLTQYTLAVDRMNRTIAKLYDQRHPAVLRMIEMTVQNAKKAGIQVGICGESAADTGLTEFYLKIGVDELSVAPSAILELKKAVREIDLK